MDYLINLTDGTDEGRKSWKQLGKCPALVSKEFLIDFYKKNKDNLAKVRDCIDNTLMHIVASNRGWITLCYENKNGDITVAQRWAGDLTL